MSNETTSTPAPKKEPFVKIQDRKLRLRFDFRAADELAGLGINIYNPATYDVMNPRHIASMVWAGQLHEKRRFTRAEIVGDLPINPDEFVDVAAAVAAALEEALGITEKKTKS